MYTRAPAMARFQPERIPLMCGREALKYIVLLRWELGFTRMWEDDVIEVRIDV